MKNFWRLRRLLPLIIIGFSTTHLLGQVFRPLHDSSSTNGTGASNPSFKILHQFDGAEGSSPSSPVVLSGDTLFVAPSYGGAADKGTIFSMKTDGTAATNLHSFNGIDGNGPAELVLVGRTIYGTTRGGASKNGTIFRMNSDGSGFTNLHSFSAGSGSWPTMITNTDGASPSGGLVLVDDTLFGVARYGGSFGRGVLFALKVDGSAFTNVHSFSASEAQNPNSLIISGDKLYATSYAGTNGNGNVFTIKKDGTGFQQLHSFSGGADGGVPNDGGLQLSENVLFGTTIWGGSNSSGTVFRLNTNGTSYAVLHGFGGPSDGTPTRGLVVWNNTLYGTTTIPDVIFAMGTNGTSFDVLYSFSGGADGERPGGLIRSANRLYGTTLISGTPAHAGNGTIFSFDVVTPLSIVPYGPELILAWPTHPSGFTLQSTTNLLSPVWNDITSAPANLNGQNIVIQPSAGILHFYRLKQ